MSALLSSKESFLEHFGEVLGDALWRKFYTTKAKFMINVVIPKLKKEGLTIEQCPVTSVQLNRLIWRMIVGERYL
jgi:Asp-tRNA(Asn)/Glu-tRNA(Gln) amidotransferase B subunit